MLLRTRPFFKQDKIRALTQTLLMKQAYEERHSQKIKR